jgi:Tfp pilus assembly protein PilV
MKAIRRGSTLLEMMIAAAMLGTLLTVCLQLCQAAAGQRRAADQRQCATLELANLMDRIAAQPWEELTAAALAGERPSPWAAGQLPGAELKVDISAPGDEPDARRITAALRWQDRSGRLGPPLQLTTWRYRSGQK